jgi:2-polyprenyl-3-methyl-5-hydroxy-6-metoxy-1,4-benzoquinol methylase
MMSKEIWNSRYSDIEYVYGKEPNVFFKTELDKLQPGRILLPAEGEGRNAVYAASQGWEVWACDQSDEGKKKALKLAEASGVSIRYDTGNLETMKFPENHFDVIALIFVHQMPDERRVFHQRLHQYLKPGGFLLSESYSKEQLKFQTGGPKDIEMLVTPELLAEDFSNLQILSNQTVQTTVNEGILHKGEAAVVRVVGRRMM